MRVDPFEHLGLVESHINALVFLFIEETIVPNLVNCTLSMLSVCCLWSSEGSNCNLGTLRNEETKPNRPNMPRQLSQDQNTLTSPLTARCPALNLNKPDSDMHLADKM
jgi:hypothetical protein